MTPLVVPEKIWRGVKKFNAWLLPPRTYSDRVALGLSAVEEVYWMAKNFVDGTVQVSERVLYEDDYHERRMGEYQGQHRLVILVPGYMQPQAGLTRLERAVGNEIFDAFTYIWARFPYSQDITLSAEQFGRVVRDLARQLTVDEIHLVGHSQGGMIIRTMVQHGLVDELPVRKCLFLSSPHQGTWSALAAIPHGSVRKMINLVPYIRRVQGESGLQLLPGSQFLRALNARPLPESIQFHSVYYALDQMIWPPTNAILPYPEAHNYFVNKVGHATSLYCSRAVQIALRALYGREAKTPRATAGGAP